VESAGPFTRDDSLPGVGASPELMASIFAVHFDPREKNSTPENVRIPTGYVVVRVTDVIPPATPTFEQARAKVEADFRRERGANLLASKLQELADRAHAEHNLRKAAAEVGATVKSSELVGPQSQVPEIGNMSGAAAAVFSMKFGDISAPINTGSGGVVIALLEKQAPPAADFDKDKEQIREELVQRKRNQMMQLFAVNLRQKMQKEGKIRINQKELERLSPATPPESGE
jgi:peptidyl-prolyl cis-trans isomerase D